MPKIGQWKKIFGHTEKERVRVQVSGKAEVMTNTQSMRFEELTKSRDTGKFVAGRNPLEESIYGLQDASFRLMISEDQLLQKAAAGSIWMYIDAAGLQGHWQRRNAAGEILRSDLRVSRSGLLALDQTSCQKLATAGTTEISTLYFRPASDPAALNIDTDILATLLAWGGDRQFRLQEPLRIGRGDVLFLSPLVLSD